MRMLSCQETRDLQPNRCPLHLHQPTYYVFHCFSPSWDRIKNFIKCTTIVHCFFFNKTSRMPCPSYQQKGGCSPKFAAGVMCEWKDEWNSKSLEEKAALLARQGVRCLERLGLRLFVKSLGKLPSPGRIVINGLEISRELCNVIM